MDADDLQKALHDALDTYMVSSYNGNDNPTDKPLREALTDMSKNVRDVMADLKKNTGKNESLEKLLEGKKGRALVINSAKTFVSSFASAFKIKFWWKIAFFIVTLYLILGSHDLPTALQNIEKLFGG